MNIRLALYIGSSIDNMSRGATVMNQTSMPIGGINTNCVIAAHRSRGFFGDIEKLKIGDIVKNVYHGSGVMLTPAAKKQAAQLEKLGFGGLPVCMAKTQYSFSDDPALLGAPEGFTVTVRNLKVSAGAGFLVALTGEIMTMPGLPKSPAAERIDVDENGKITGLF